MNRLIDYGFVKPTFETQHLVLGGIASLPKIIYQPDGNWEAYLPVYEPQTGEGWDTNGCAVWGTLNAVETFEKRLTGIEKNYSERFIYNLAGVRPPGADPHYIAETIRHQGNVLETELPFTKTFNEFIMPQPMSKELLDKGQVWLKNWNFGNEWLWKYSVSQDEKLNKIKEALQYSPLGVSVTAWFQNDKGQYYSPQGQDNTHWCVLYKVDDKGLYVFDSYDQSKKILTFDHNIQFAKRYNLVDIHANLIQQVSLLTQVLNLLKQLYAKIYSVGGELLSGIFSKRN